MKNLKMSTVITTIVSCVTAVCILLLFLTASRNMTVAMRNTAMDTMTTSLNARAEIIEQYVDKAEKLLISFRKAPIVSQLLQNLADEELAAQAEEYTLDYYADLVGWEGLYIAEFDSHVLTHNNPGAVGMYTRQGDPLKALQDAILASGSIYNVGIIVSPASQQLTLSLYSAVYGENGDILGYVGGGQFASELVNELSALHVEGLGNAKNYMINVKTGVHIYDEDESLMSQPIENKMLLDAIKIINSNPSKLIGEIEYVDPDGVKCIAVYRYLPDRGWAVLLSDSEDEIYQAANSSRNMLALVCVVSYAVITLLSFLSVKMCIKPLNVVKKSISRLKNLELETPEEMKPYIDGKSETGMIATAMDSLYDTLRDIVSTLRGCTESLGSSTGKMGEATSTLIECVSDNSATTEELAASIATTNEAIENVAQEIERISELVGNVEKKVMAGEEKSNQLIHAAKTMKGMAEDTLSETGTKIEVNRKNVEAAMKNLQSLTRVNDMANQILEIL